MALSLVATQQRPPLVFDPVTRTFAAKKTRDDSMLQEFLRVQAKRSDGLRTPSNLITYAQRKLSSSEIHEGFFGFYFGRQQAALRLSARLFYLGLLMSFLQPNVKLATMDRRWARANRMLFRSYMKAVKPVDVSMMTQVSKDLEKGAFVIRAPIVYLPSSLFKLFKGVMYQPDAGTEVQVDPIPQEGQVYESSHLKPANGFLTSKVIAGLEACNAKLINRNRGDAYVFFLQLEMTKEQASYLTTLPWNEIRPIDIYGPLRDWVGGFNIKRKAPAFTVPLTKIRSHLPPTKDKRVNEDGVLIDENGEYWCIPDKLDAIETYDSAFSTHLSNPSHFFSACDDNLVPKTNRPAAQPVFIDWVNLKFAYSTTASGILTIKDLSRCLPATVTHYYRLFNAAYWSTAYVVGMISRADALGRKFGTYNGKPADEILDEYYKKMRRLQDQSGISTASQFTLRFIYEHSSLAATGKLSPLSEQDVNVFLTSLPKTLKAIEDNIAAANRDFSVETVSKLLAFLRIVTRWGPKYEEVHTADAQRREKYSKQWEDPNYKLEKLPYLAQGRFMLPHQVKVNNMMRTSPDFAMLAVDAGGGKTPLSVYDFLKELKNNPDIRGLILCPSTLVSQHVKEFVDFTNGLVNTIPVTTYTVKRHGLERLQEMIVNSPTNTVVIADYGVLYRLSPTKVGYGTTTQIVFPGVEFLRQFRFDWVFCDESHFLKNASSMNSTVGRLISEIPKKRLASGTFVANVITDIVRQTALFDPTIFGTYNDFVNKYSTGHVKGKLTWDEAKVSEDLRKEVVWAEARRKEWAALLPPVEPTFRIVPMEGSAMEPDENGFTSKAVLTARQKDVYNQIMTMAKEEIIAKSKENTAEGKRLRKLLKGFLDVEDNQGTEQPTPTDEDDDGEDQTTDDKDEGEDEDDDVVDLEALLHPYLQRLEQFMTAPASDPLGKQLLTDPKDKVSPKVTRIIEVLDEHFAGIANGTIQGKVLIFTSYIESGAAIYEGLPPKYKDMCIHFMSNNQAACKAEFENNPKKMIMVGVENSMNTGLNFQFVSRLIRVESVWTPGQFEQGNSRLVRPSLKTAEFRNVVFLDWIVCDRSIDITKSCFLIQKIISKSKFDEYKGWPGYQLIPTPPPFKMNLETIFEFNSADVLTNDYLQPYAVYLQEQQNEYSEFRTRYEKTMREKMGSANYDKWVKEKGSPLVWENLSRSENLPNSKIMARVPYVPGIQLYGTEHLGLIRYDEFLRINPAELEFSDEEDEQETPEQKLRNEAEMRKLYGLYAHTDYGDGEIVRVNNFSVVIRLESGTKITTHKLATFIITKAETSGRDMRLQLAKLNGEMPLGKEPEVPGAALTKVNKVLQQIKKQITEKVGSDDTRVPMVVTFGTLNDFLIMQIVNLTDPRVIRAGQAMGFGFMPAHYALRVQRQERLKHIVNVWSKSGTPEDKKPLTPKLTMDPSCSKALQNVWNHMVKKGLKGNELFGTARATEIRVFQKIMPKAEPRKTHIFPYPYVEDGNLYLGLPSVGHPASLIAIKILKAKAAPGAGMWKLISDTERMYLIAPNKARAIKKMDTMEANGIVIVNREEAEAKLKAMKQVIEVKHPEDE